MGGKRALGGHRLKGEGDLNGSAASANAAFTVATARTHRVEEGHIHRTATAGSNPMMGPRVQHALGRG
jgi:hypothetical protein